MKCFRQEAVAGKNGHGFAEHLVIGGFSAPQVVVVHGGQVIVNKGVGVDEFQSAGNR